MCGSVSRSYMSISVCLHANACVNDPYLLLNALATLAKAVVSMGRGGGGGEEGEESVEGRGGALIVCACVCACVSA